MKARGCEVRGARSSRVGALAMRHAHEDALAELARLFALIDEAQAQSYGIDALRLSGRAVFSPGA